MDNINHPPPVVSVADAAAMLTICRASAYNLINKGELISLKVGGRTVVTLASIKQLLDGPSHQQAARRCLMRRGTYNPIETKFLKQVGHATAISTKQSEWLARLTSRLI